MKKFSTLKRIVVLSNLLIAVLAALLVVDGCSDKSSSDTDKEVIKEYLKELPELDDSATKEMVDKIVSDKGYANGLVPASSGWSGFSLSKDEALKFGFPVEIEGIDANVLVYLSHKELVEEKGVFETISEKGDIFIHPSDDEIDAYLVAEHPVGGDRDIIVENFFYDENGNVVECQNLRSLVISATGLYPDAGNGK